jgi:hypothetical protein
MAMIKMHAVGLGIKFVDKNAIVTNRFNPIHRSFMDPVKVEGMGMAGTIVENNANAIAFSGA